MFLIGVTHRSSSSTPVVIVAASAPARIARWSGCAISDEGGPRTTDAGRPRTPAEEARGPHDPADSLADGVAAVRVSVTI